MAIAFDLLGGPNDPCGRLVAAHTLYCGDEGFHISLRREERYRPGSVVSSHGWARSMNAFSDAIRSVTSTPVQKTRSPDAARTTTLTSSSVFTSPHNWKNSACIWSLNALRTSGRLSVTVIDPIFCGLHHDRLVGHLSSPPFLPEGHGLWKLLVDREFHARVDTLRHLPLDIQSITAIAGIPRAATAFASMGSDDPHRRPLLDYSLFDGDWVDGGARRIYKRYW